MSPSSLGAPVFSDGGPRSRVEDDEGNPKLRFGVAAERDGASDIMNPVVLDGAILGEICGRKAEKTEMLLRFVDARQVRINEGLLLGFEVTQIRMDGIEGSWV